ncbi:kinase-like domain-containing protein [Nemania sp. FL0031]|nr:kinase-like domain-containing protein [Nemania sp. FL0031]
MRAQPIVDDPDVVMRDIGYPYTKEEAEADERTDLVRTHFDDKPGFSFESFIGNGVSGMTFSIIEKRMFLDPRRLIVKRVMDETRIEDLNTDIRLMKMLSGSAHIASVVATSHDPGEKEIRFVAGLPAPTLVLEYVENGNLKRIRDKLIRNQVSAVQNRLLWKWFLCLARACVAMKFPPGRPVDSKPQLEELPYDQSNPTNIIHFDLHEANIVIGTMEDFPEHNLVPPLKLIDFGNSVLGENDTMNIHDVGQVMHNLIRGDGFGTRGVQTNYNGIETYATGILPHNGVDMFPRLDPDLRHLVALCLAVNPQNRPSTAELLYYCKLAVESKPPEWYGPYQFIETDEAISQTLQQLIYNAN